MPREELPDAFSVAFDVRLGLHYAARAATLLKGLGIKRPGAV